MDPQNANDSNKVVDFSHFDLDKRKNESLKELDKVMAQDKKQTAYVIFIVIAFFATAILYAVYFNNRAKDIRHAPKAPTSQSSG